jgi:hypothetical protein
MNSWKHGKYARTAYVLRHEDREAFEAFVDVLVRRFQPVDPLEYHYVRQLAFVEWRMLRNCTLDTAVTDREFELRSNALNHAAENLPSEERESVSNAVRFALVVENLLNNSKLPNYLAARESQLIYARSSILQTLKALRKGYPLSASRAHLTDLTSLSVDNSFENEFQSDPPQDAESAPLTQPEQQEAA